MRLPLTRYGWLEILLFCAIFLGAAILAFTLATGVLAKILGAGAIISLLFCLNFFRDPDRHAPADPRLVISPADGKVADIGRIENTPHLGGPSMRVGIFLSVFDVHVNRAPVPGRVRHTKHKPGRFLDARDPACATENEAQDLVLETPAELGGFPVFVRQIAGLIARRIVCAVKPGTDLARGQRYGMIKFGSRTEVYLPVDRVEEISVRVGDRVKGGQHVLARLKVPA